MVMSLFIIWLVWCSNLDNQVVKLDSQEWEHLFNNQVDGFQYIKDLEDYLSYDILSITEDRPYSLDFSFSVKFDKNSSLQWWLELVQKKFIKSKDLETSDIDFKINAENSKKEIEPFDLSWSVSLLYKDSEMYANLHNLNVFMWEGNMTAKMYTLLWDMIIDKWVDLEIHSGWVIEVDESDNKRLPYIVWTLKNVLKSERINEDSPNFLNGVAELIDTVNSRVDLWISTNELKMINHEISYSKLWDKSIQKEFTWSFQWKQSAFDLSFIASQEWIQIHVYNIKIKEYDADISDYSDTDTEFMFSLKEDKKSEYSVNFESSKLQQKVIDLKWKIKYSDKLDFSADFILEPLEIEAWEKFSWKLDGYIIKKSWEFNEQIPEISGNVLLWSDLLSSL